jgi:hypothetical protein
VAVYDVAPVTGENVTVAVVEDCEDATTLVGASTVIVSTGLDGVEGGDDPAEFVAVTVNVYTVFGVNPVTITGELNPVPEILPGIDVAVYVVTSSLILTKNVSESSEFNEVFALKLKLDVVSKDTLTVVSFNTVATTLVTSGGGVGVIGFTGVPRNAEIM